MSFASDIRKFALSTKVRGDKIVRKILIDVVKELVQRTPVLTGLARSNWFFGYTVNGSVGAEASRSGGPSIMRSLDFAANLRGGKDFFISNNLPYILALEYGHSKTQAPAGMARVTVAKWQWIVDNASRSFV